MAELKTKLTDKSFESFLNGIENEEKRKDCFEIAKMMGDATGAPAKMWGGSILGFGNQHLIYDSGRELDWFIIGFSPRKANIALYIGEKSPELMKKLGKYKTGASCLYINKLADIDTSVLKLLMKESVGRIKKGKNK
jgi:hypothetical protein